jgi:hypothetical protein
MRRGEVLPALPTGNLGFDEINVEEPMPLNGRIVRCVTCQRLIGITLLDPVEDRATPRNHIFENNCPHGGC